MAAAMSKLRLRMVLTFVLGLVVGALLAVSWNPAPAHIRSGSTLAGFESDAILSITYRTPEGATTAQRSKEGAPLAVQKTFADSRAAEHCFASSDLAGMLLAFSDLIVKRSLSLKEREKAFPMQVGVLDIQTIGIAEPSNPILVFTDQKRSGTIGFVRFSERQ